MGATTNATTTSTDTEKIEGRELLDLDVGEVSLVDRGAIRRTFSVVKALTEDEKTIRLEGEGDMGAKKVATTKAEEPAKVEKGEVDVEKAVPLLSAIASERLGLITTKVGEIQAGLGTMSKADASTALYSLHDMIWSAERDVCAVSKSLGIEPPAPPAERVAAAVEKAHPRKMTSRRLSEFKALAEKFTGLLKEFECETETEDPEEDPMGTAAAAAMKSEGGAAATTPAATTPDVAAVVTAAVEKALKPIEDRLAKVEKAAEPAKTEPAKVEKAADPAPEWAVNLKKSLDEVGQRLDAIEGSSNAGGGNRTEKVETQKAADKGSIWDGIVTG